MPTNATLHIGRRPAENILHAIRYARETGQPINRHITISFVALDIPDDQAGTIFAQLQERIMRWWRYERQQGRVSGALVGVHSHANPAGSRHVDWLLHIPTGCEAAVEKAIIKRLRKLTGVKDLRDALHVQPVGGAGGLAKYILRGIDPTYADYLHIEPAPEGLVTCRRTGASRALSRKARKDAGWSRRAGRPPRRPR